MTRKAPRRPPGRPSLLTPQLSKRIVSAIRNGSYIEEAAEAQGVSRQLVYQWLQQGNEGKTPLHVAFLDAVTRARAQDAVASMALINRAAKLESGDVEWKAAAWKLERKLPAKFGPKVRITVVEELSGFLEELSRVLPVEWYEKVLEVAARRGGGGEVGSLAGVTVDSTSRALAGGVPDDDSAAQGEGVRAAPSPEAAP